MGFHIATRAGRNRALCREQSSAGAGVFNFPQPASRDEILKALDESVATVRELCRKFDDAAMHETWRLIAGEKELLAQPRADFMRDVMLSHWYQHRGQLSVYLRLLNIPVPASWGPSADEPPLFMQNKRQPNDHGGEVRMCPFCLATAAVIAGSASGNRRLDRFCRGHDPEEVNRKTNALTRSAKRRLKMATTTTEVKHRKVVSHEEWIAARKQISGQGKGVHAAAR